jgi:mannose-6-phosphate isomerase-like protein (cupin superfamily)
MNGYVNNIEKETLDNEAYRKVIYTAHHSQLVVMSLKPGEEIGEEVHEVDQFLRIEQGNGKAVLDGVEHEIKDGFAILVPAGTRHNIINGMEGSMKLYTVYAPPEHQKDTAHSTKQEAESDAKDHFDGTISE